jgi:hypothetical protein
MDHQARAIRRSSRWAEAFDEQTAIKVVDGVTEMNAEGEWTELEC